MLPEHLDLLIFLSAFHCIISFSSFLIGRRLWKRSLLFLSSVTDPLRPGYFGVLTAKGERARPITDGGASQDRLRVLRLGQLNL